MKRMLLAGLILSCMLAIPVRADTKSVEVQYIVPERQERTVSSGTSASDTGTQVTSRVLVRAGGNTWYVKKADGDLHRCSIPSYTSGDPQVSGGSWVQTDSRKHTWAFQNSQTGETAKDGWYILNNPYSRSGRTYSFFHFGKDGKMDTGWYLEEKSGTWYYLREINDGDYGSLEYGWYTDAQDGNTYYLDSVTGAMYAGKKTIEGYQYYFAEPYRWATWYKDSKTGRWLYRALGGRPYGSMYRNEKTPDGMWAGPDGKCTQLKKE